VLPLVSLIVFQAFVLSLGALFRLLLAYLNPPHRTGTFHTVHRLASLVYGLLLLGNVLFVLSFADMILAWHVLSTFAFPARTLRQTAAIAALAYVALSIGSQMLGPQAALRDKLHAAFLGSLQPALRKAHQRAKMKLRLRRAAAVGKHLARSTREQDIDTADVEALLSSREEYADARGGPRSGDEWREYTEGGTSRLEPTRAADRPLGPSDVFLLLSGDGSAPLEATEFRALFESLQLPLTTRQKELLFSQVEMEREYALERNERRKRLSSQVQRWRDRRQHCSAALLGCLHGRGLVLGGKEDSHAEVSSREFGEAWEAMEQGVLQAGVAAAGVSNTKVVLEVLGGVALLSALLLVIALGAESFGITDGDEFGAVLQALVVVACGLAVSVFRPRSQAEISCRRHELDALVRGLVDKQLEQASSDSG